MKKYFFLLLFISDFSFAAWNVRGMSNTSSVTSASINFDSSIAISIRGDRFPAGGGNNFVCNVGQGKPLGPHWQYLVWFLEDIKINNQAVTFNVPNRLYDSVSSTGYFNVEKSVWINNGRSLVIVAREPRLISDAQCSRGQRYSFSSSFTGKPVGVTIPPGTHTLRFNLRVMRIQSLDGANSVYNLAMTHRNLSTPTALSAAIKVMSYCTKSNVNSITLDHGKIMSGTGDGKEISAEVLYECNQPSIKPTITFSGVNVTSGNQVKICDGMISTLNATTEHLQGYKFKTIFKSTLKGNASSSCAGLFSKDVVAIIRQP